ncbi:DIS3-like exonuclease 2 [Thrips palmi]|uniref:DIS3-like exonuclease 2 n=1 Tax=Thrips palmi TaxID=161013 RepID=A0A6P8YAE3_THRPL|nr:DIS3-like exonuclease 2 [Thrips palmi]
MMDVDTNDEPKSGNDAGAIGENVELENLQAQPTAKKRNRRKERSRKKKPDLETDQSAAIATQMEAVRLDSASPQNGVPELRKGSEGSAARNLDGGENSSSKLVSSAKKKAKRRKNVALSSIEKLSIINGTPSVSVSNGNSNLGRGLLTSSMTNVELPELKASNSMQGGPLSNGPTNHKSAKHRNSPDPGQLRDQLDTRRGSKNQLPRNRQRTSDQQRPHGAAKNKQDHGGSRNKTFQRKHDHILDENKFEPHLQRELVQVMLKEQQTVVKGFIRINQRNYREAYISNPDGTKDILIDGVKDRNRAFEGDEVVVLILPQSTWKQHEGALQKVGKVIHIWTPVHHRQAVGNLKRLQDGNSRQVLFSPRDSRIPRMRIPIKECPYKPNEWENCLFQARITEWEDVRFAVGRLVGDSVGAEGDIEAETRALLLDNEINWMPYEEKLFKYFPSTPFTPAESDLVGREDLRKRCIFTIDPLTARDLDDAVSCEKLKNGNFKVGVHISDVSFFLKEGTALDKEVAKRATTTYLVQRAYHMLPRQLTMMCSLLPGEDKLAFSVFWEITPKAEVVSHYFTRSVINSCAQLAYEHAQIMIDEPDHNWTEGELPQIFGGWTVEDLKEVVLSLQSLAAIMRQERFDSGALRVDQPKVVFRLNESGEPISYATYANKESHRLIEEFMLLANMTVATDLQNKFPRLAFLRCHEEPQPDLLKKLIELVEKFGIVLDGSSAGSLHKSIQGYSTDNRTRFLALNSLCSRPMVRARYFCAANIHDVKYMRHYALNVPLYTHFTSPIRRYADVMVHRLLSSLLGYCNEPNWTVDYVNTIAATCNKMKFCAKKAGEQSSELFFAIWVRNHGPVEEEVIVIDVKDHSFDALVSSTGTNIRVYTNKLAASVEFDNSVIPQLCIKWAVSENGSKLTHQVITMFSVVRVSLRCSNTNLLKVEASLIPPGF